MYTNKIKELLLQKLFLEQVYVISDENHYKIFAIDKVFIGKSVLERHKLIYAPIMEFITSNKIHAISIHAFCPEEWRN